MGLSDEERISGLYYDINKMVKLVDALKKDADEYWYPKKLVDLVDQLWHAFLGKKHNSSHWILGSSATNTITDNVLTPWGIAINHHCNDLFKEKGVLTKSDQFDAFDGFLDISGLLGQVQGPYQTIYDTFSWSEQAIYHLRRYEDSLLNELNSLSKIISDINGECFVLFLENDVYARAYVLYNITKMLYSEFYPYRKEKWDLLTKYLDSDASHHDLSRMIQSRDGNLKVLAEIHIKLSKAKENNKLTLMLRTETFLQLAGRRYHYDHQFNKLIKILKGKLKAAEIQKLKGLFEKCKKEHDEDEKQSQKDYEQKQGSQLSIYNL